MPSLLSQLGTKVKDHVITAIEGVDATDSVLATLRGTKFRHLGGYKNQPFHGVDNWDFSGHLYINEGKLYMCTANGTIAATFGLAVVEDSTEPDIEMTTETGLVVSAITGDTDRKDAHGNPYRAGFRNPDLGGNQIRAVISGGQIDQSPFPLDKVLKLQRKDFIISPFLIGSSSDVTQFKKEAILGQVLFCTDTKDFYVAEKSGDGTTDATLSKFTPATTGQ